MSHKQGSTKATNNFIDLNKEDRMLDRQIHSLSFKSAIVERGKCSFAQISKQEKDEFIAAKLNDTIELS